MKPVVKSAVRLGTAVTALIALLPYISDFFLTAYVAGPLAAVWFAIRGRRENLSFKDGANLGFLSGFYGALVATAIHDLVWKVFHYELWRVQNLDRVIALSTEALRDAFTPSIWLLITLQIILAAICAGAFGAPAGILGVKLFQRRIGQ